jgi:hypothetical protein
MDLIPWLLLIVAGLCTGCVVLYCHLKQVESSSLNREALVLEEVEELRATLKRALDRIGAIEEGRMLLPPGAPSRGPWQSRAIILSRSGLNTVEIARELEVSISEVELALTFPLRMPDE